jgi:AraC-like DNA-binding protein
MSYADGILAAALAMLDTPSWDARSRHQLRPEALTRLLRQRIDQPMDLGWLAGELGLSKAHLCRLCRKWFDTSPGRLWTEMKMDWAAVLLREPSLSVAEVAKRVGYDDPFYFSKVFRRFHGRPPSRARAEPTCNAST